MLGLAVVLLLTDRFAPRNSENVAAASDKSIAVLPLVNASGDDKQQFFSDGISESLIVALSQAPGLTVIGRNSSFRFRDGKTDSKTVGEKLGVARLLGGSVQHAGDMVRISVELVDAPSGRALWSQRYDRPYKDLFALQDDITTAVADVLKAKLLGDAPTAQSDRPPSGNIEAYNALLEANFQAAKLTDESNRRAIALLDRAIALDPNYALAYAKRARAWTFPLAWNDPIVAKGLVAASPARADVRRALALNPNLAYAHAIAGNLSGYIDGDPAAAEADYRRALALQPDLSVALTGLSRQMSQAGRYPEAIDLIRRSLLSDPLSATAYAQLARLLQLTGQLDEAQAAFDKVRELLPDAPGVQANFVWLAITRGDAETAMRSAQAMPPGKFRDDSLAAAAQIGTDRAAADTALRDYIDKQGEANPSGVAEMYALRSEPGPMFDWLKHALAADDPGAKWPWEDPYFIRYRNDPRFAEYCKQAGIVTPAQVDAANAAYPAKRANEAGAR
ncbi:MAG: tetratricopeptide repeat protein [Proteobacteria bacterium]|uniref:tetratricopeptide repeat protein n=1 Tax=Rudaea sp. TaxID=2136325 RepID=UPI00321FBC33|nr:tetratricopeptide repeat protein [Pseudomonadota bacterium]